MVAKKRKAETAKKKTTTTTKNNAKKKKTTNQKKKADNEEKPNSSKFGLRCDAFDAGFSKRVKNFPKLTRRADRPCTACRRYHTKTTGDGRSICARIGGFFTCFRSW